MRKVVVSEFVSLDGVMEEPDWSLRLTGEEQQEYKLDELSAADALLLGRTTYEELAASWPHESEPYGGYTDMMNSYPKHVVSTTLQGPLEWNASPIERDELAEEVPRLKQEPGKDILVYGSGDLVDTLMEHDLVDEYRLMVFPIVVGRGKRLFVEGREKNLKLAGTQTFGSGVVVLTYHPGDPR